MIGGVLGGAVLKSDFDKSTGAEKIPRYVEARVAGTAIGPGRNRQSRKKRAGRRCIKH
jgi:hypothetical protein